MMVKLLMSWDIQAEREQDYFEFVVKEFVPGITRMGLQPSEAWVTIYGNQPQVLTGAIADNLPTLKDILDSQDWQRLHGRLLDLVDNYDQKIVRAGHGLQL